MAGIRSIQVNPGHLARFWVIVERIVGRGYRTGRSEVGGRQSELVSFASSASKIVWRRRFRRIVVARWVILKFWCVLGGLFLRELHVEAELVETLDEVASLALGF